MISSLVVSCSDRHDAAPLVLEGGDHHRQRIEGLLPGPHPRAGGQDLAPVLGPALVDPEEGVAHRHVVVGRPQIGGAPELAVPRVDVLVGDHVAVPRALVPLGELRRGLTVLGGAMVLERRVPAEGVAQREQEVVVVVVAGAEELVGLLHHRPVKLEDLGLDLEEVRPPREEVEVHRGDLVPGREVVSLRSGGPARTGESTSVSRGTRLKVVTDPVTDAVSRAVPSVQPSGSFSETSTGIRRVK